MKAAVHTRYGPPEVVQISQVGKPTPGDGELLVKIHATTVNRTDCHYRSGRPWITGAIGSAAVQLLKTLGATVTAVCATPHLDLVRKLGADKVIDYTAGDFTSGGQDYDVVFDAAGKSSFARCKRLLKPGGIYMSTGPGPWYQNLLLPLATPLLRGKKVVFAYPRLDQATVRRFAQLMESGQFTPVIDRHYPLDQIVDAYRYVETGQKIGNVVIIVDPSH